MKGILRSIFINFCTLLLISKIFGCIRYSDSYVILFWASLSLTLINFLIKPILNLILMPITLLTLGATRWVLSVVVLFLVTLVVPGFGIENFYFSGHTFSGFVIPAFSFTSLWAFFLVSFLVDIISGFISWLFK